MRSATQSPQKRLASFFLWVGAFTAFWYAQWGLNLLAIDQIGEWALNSRPDDFLKYVHWIEVGATVCLALAYGLLGALLKTLLPTRRFAELIVVAAPVVFFAGLLFIDQPFSVRSSGFVLVLNAVGTLAALAACDGVCRWKSRSNPKPGCSHPI